MGLLIIINNRNILLLHVVIYSVTAYPIPSNVCPVSNLTLFLAVLLRRILAVGAYIPTYIIITHCRSSYISFVVFSHKIFRTLFSDVVFRKLNTCE